MRINLFRLLFIILFIWIIFWKLHLLIVYSIVILLSVEFLNTKQQYKQLNYTLYNSIFFGLLLFTTLIRSRNFTIDLNVKWLLNGLEHFLFSIIICLKICIYIFVLSRRKLTPLQLACIAVLIFNFIGLGNEFYQNLFSTKKTFFQLDFGSKIDLMVNFCSSLLLLNMIYFFPNSFLSIKNKNSENQNNLKA